VINGFFANAQTDSIPAAKIPFDGMDLSWINGQSRVKNPPLIMTDKKQVKLY